MHLAICVNQVPIWRVCQFCKFLVNYSAFPYYLVSVQVNWSIDKTIYFKCHYIQSNESFTALDANNSWLPHYHKYMYWFLSVQVNVLILKAF